jgi:SHS2 domain-containing protein
MEAVPRWEHFEHRADMGVRGVGRTLAQAFEQAALAMTAVVVDIEAVRTPQSLHVECSSSDLDLLLVEWLNRIVYEMSVRRMLFGHFTVHVEGTRLAAEIQGEAVDVVRHQPAVEVKGATMTGLRVGQQPDGIWIAQCVVDV